MYKFIVSDASWRSSVYETIDETIFKIECLKFLVALCIQIKKRFPLEEGCVASLGILDSVAAQDLTKDPSSLANMALYLPPFCAWRSAGGYIDRLNMCPCPSLNPASGIICVTSSVAAITRSLNYLMVYGLTKFMVLSHSSASLERIFSLVQTKTNSLKPRLLRKSC